MRVEGLPEVPRCAGTAYISGVGATLSGPKIPMNVDLVDFLLCVHPDGCRPVGGPQRLTRQCAGLILVWTGPLRRRTSALKRRRTPRYYVQLPVESARGTGATLDVNEDGVRFETNHRFVYGEVVTLRLVFRHIAGDYTHIDVTGAVVRVAEVAEMFVVALRVDGIHVDSD